MRETLGSVLAHAATTLSKAGCEEARRRARQLVAASLGLSPTELLMNPDRTLACSEAVRLLGLVGRMARGEPLSRVLGRREFWGLDFVLSAETLDPRPESETVVEAVLARLLDRGGAFKFLDLGTGTGCLLLALLSEFPSAIGFGVDVSEGAAATARRNARALGLIGRAAFLVADWASALCHQFDVIVANPPYIATAALADLPRQVGGFDPRRALDGGEDGLAAYRSIAAHLPTLLGPFGIFVAEVGAGQAGAVTTILQNRGLAVEGIERDLAGIERCVAARASALEGPGLTVSGQKILGMCRRRV